MPFLPGYRHDVFVSYSHGPVPQQGFSGGPRQDALSNWARRFVDDLKSLVDVYIGVKDATEQADIWMDPILEGHLPLEENLRTHVQGSALLLVVTSPMYLLSAWCRRELECFSAARRGAAGSMFVVRCMATDDATWPGQLKDADGVPLPGYWLHAAVPPDSLSEPFGWPRRGDEDREYWLGVRRVAQELARELQRQAWLLKQATPPRGAVDALVPPSVGRRVLLGYMHDTLLDDGVAAALRAALTSRGMTVLPPEDKTPTGEAELRATLDAYLPESEAIVLAANEHCTIWPAGQDGGAVGFQLERAKSLKVPSYLWLNLDDLGAVKRVQYREWLGQLQDQAAQGGPPLKFADADAFVDLVRQKLDATGPLERGVERLAVICTNARQGEAQHASLYNKVASLIEDRLVPIWTAPTDPRTGQIRLENIKEAINRADTVVILCFDQNYKWALDFWKQIRSEQIMQSNEAKRIFLIGPKDVGNGEFQLPRFLKIKSTGDDDLADLGRMI